MLAGSISKALITTAVALGALSVWEPLGRGVLTFDRAEAERREGAVKARSEAVLEQQRREREQRRLDRKTSDLLKREEQARKRQRMNEDLRQLEDARRELEQVRTAKLDQIRAREKTEIQDGDSAALGAAARTLLNRVEAYQPERESDKAFQEEMRDLAVKINWGANGAYYHTTGCAFDQQMIYENHTATLAAAAELGIEDDFTALLREQVKRLDPVLIGDSGQIKEFREEKAYGEIGEYAHRHVSHLVSLYPGCAIHADTPAWIEAAETTLDLRGDLSTGWGMAHRMLLWARTKDGARAYRLFRMLLERTTYSNLWAAHPPFQIDANFGATAGVAEMLLQSHEGFIEPLPALPPEWASGSFAGLCARGCFEVSATWRAHRLETVSVRSQNGGGLCHLKLGGFATPVAEPAIDFAFDPQSGVATFTVKRGETISFHDAAAGAVAAC